MYNESLPSFALINRMKTDKINELLAFNQKYPSTGQLCIDELMNNVSWCYLTYNTICTLNDIFHCGYGPNGIASLFEPYKR